MGSYAKMKLLNLKDKLHDKGIVTKNLDKPFLTVLLENLDNGNIEIRPDSDTTYSEEIIVLKERINELESELYNKILYLNRTLDSSKCYKNLARQKTPLP